MRPLLVTEVAALFAARRYRVQPAVDLSTEHALRDLGNGAHGDVVMWQMQQFFEHVRPPNSFVPTSVDQVLSTEAAVGVLEVL